MEHGLTDFDHLNSYTFHINLYDLASVGTIFIGLNFTLLLWFTKSIHRTANRLLAAALLTMVLWMLRILAIDIRLETYLPHWDRLPLQFLLALGPLIYFYVLKITRPEYKFSWRDLLHFGPLLLEQVFLALQIKESAGTGSVTYATAAFRQWNPPMQLLIFISIITYLYLSHKLIQNFYRRLQPVLMDRSLLEFRWLRRLLAATALLWLLWIAYAAVDYFGYHNQSGIPIYYPFYIFFAVIIIWTAMAAFLRPQAGAIAQSSSALKPSAPAELREKGTWVKRSMKVNLYYQDPELSLGSLAEKLDLTTHELSRILNTVLKKSFNDFINEYRVIEVIRKMQDPAYNHITLLGMAFDAGFNSKATFIRAFKQMTGKNPAAYKRELEKEVSSYHLQPRYQSRQIILVPEIPKWSHEQLNYNYMFRNYLKTALRSFRKHKLFTFINVIGLSIGISASLVIFLIVYHDFTFDRFHQGGDRIYRVVSDYSSSGDKFYNPGVAGPLGDGIKNEVTGVEVSAPLYTPGYSVSIPGGKEQQKFKNEQNLSYADQRYFKIFSYHWLSGSDKTLDQPNQVVLASKQAQKYFPGLTYDQMIGRQVVYEDSIRTSVAGVVEEFKENTDFTYTDFISRATIPADKDLKRQQDEWTSTTGNSLCFIRLAPGTTAAGIEKQLVALKKKYAPNRTGTEIYKSKWSLQPLADIHFNEHYGANNNAAANKNTLYGLMAIAAFLLTLACINFINLTTAQASQRSKEIGIRKTMGSTRGQLIGQFLSETTLVTVLAVLVSLGLTPFIIKLFSEFIDKSVKLSPFDHPVIFLFIGLLVIVVSFVSGFYPAMVLSKYQPVTVLKNQVSAGSSKTRNSFLRKSLTVTQFVVAQFFIMATLVVSKQIYYALHKDLGFKKDAIVYVRLPGDQKTQGLREVFANKVKALPQVALVSLGDDVPSSDNWTSNDATFRDGKKEIHTELYHKSGDGNYINIYKIKLIAGRNIQQSDTLKNMLVNSTYATTIGFKNLAGAIGKVIEFNKDTRYQIVGVFSDFHQSTLKAPIKAMAIFPTNYGYSKLHIALRPETAGGNDWKTALTGVEKAFKEVYPANDYAYTFFDQAIAKMYGKEQNTSKLLTWATGLSIFISCLGLLGLAMFTTNLRTKEIGVRKVLGASVAQIVTLLSTELVGLIALSFLVATPIAWYAMNKWMQDFADHTSFSWWIFVISGAGMLLTALVTLSFQTIKAAIANPVKSLRNE